MNLKEVKQRIASVTNTRKITSAMKLVSAAKLRKAQAAIESMLPYQSKLTEIMAGFLASDTEVETPYTDVRKVKRVAIFVVSSNTSLCGGFNANIIRHLKSVIEEYKELGEENILIYPVGRKVTDAVKKMKIVPAEDLSSIAANRAYRDVSALGARLMQLFATKQVDKVELIYNHFKSSSVQLLTRKTYLPIDLTAAQPSQKSEIFTDYIVEPSLTRVMEELIPKVLCLQLYTAVIDSAAAEQGARVVAMQVATDNADDLITDLTREYNKGRQQAITNELLDIASGSLEA